MKVADHFTAIGTKFICKLCKKELNKPRDGMFLFVFALKLVFELGTTMS